MAPKKTKKKSPKHKSELTLRLDGALEPRQAELVAKIPWFNERYLLPGEEASDYDLHLQLLIESIGVKDTLDAILIKDIHDELREVHRMRALRQAILLRGMARQLSIALRTSYSSGDEARVEDVFELWNTDHKAGNKALTKLLDEADITIGRLMADAFSMESKKLQQLELQLARHEKNVRETLKMIDLRKNHMLMRQRVEFDLEHDRQQRSIDNSDGNG